MMVKSLYQKALLKLYHISLKFSGVCSRNTVNKENGIFSNGQSVDFLHRDYRHTCRYNIIYMDRFVFPSLFTTIGYFAIMNFFSSNKTKKYSKHRKIFKHIMCYLHYIMFYIITVFIQKYSNIKQKYSKNRNIQMLLARQKIQNGQLEQLPRYDISSFNNFCYVVYI